MANEISGINLLLALDGTAVAAQSNATLSASQEIVEIITKNEFGFTSNLSSDQSWSVSHDGYLTKESGDHFLAIGEATFSIDVGGTMTVVPGIQSVSLSLTQELTETPPGIDEATNWTYRRPSRRSFSIDVDGHYYDPADEPTYDAILDAKDAGETLDFELTVAGLTFTGSLAPGDLEIEAGADGDNATYSLSSAGDGEIIKTGTSETSIGKVLDAYFTQAMWTVLLKHEVDGTQVDGSTEWTGDAYLSEATLDIERGDQVSLSADFQGDGALTRPTYTAA